MFFKLHVSRETRVVTYSAELVTQFRGTTLSPRMKRREAKISARKKNGTER